ncbi:MAG: hypothetical protein GWM89_12590 [Candidatus Dadabacteria bacterium]|nr:hypothetical protein [Candidatus Dadabacteria bacterium]NIX16660.1 hypothetical protein [Candidatus Dadabacteria bacterium]NIY23226.1 hypothetical protein [Candidatus Dadabacteria bacterium]
MNNKKLSVCLILLLITTLLSGCVYYRLLKLKHQFENFEENFELEDKKGLTIIFKNPILYKDDIKWLLNNEPTKILDETGEQNSWVYILTKKNKEGVVEEKNYDIDIAMEFEGKKLKEVTLPERFLENLSKEMLARMLKSMGRSKVDKSKKKAGTTMGGKKEGLPTIYDVLHTLGQPYENHERKEITKLKYFYTAKKPENGSELKPFDLIFDFDVSSQDKVLRKSDVNINGLKMSINFVVE